MAPRSLQMRENGNGQFGLAEPRWHLAVTGRLAVRSCETATCYCFTALGTDWEVFVRPETRESALSSCSHSPSQRPQWDRNTEWEKSREEVRHPSGVLHLTGQKGRFEHLPLAYTRFFSKNLVNTNSVASMFSLLAHLHPVYEAHPELEASAERQSSRTTRVD